MLNIDYCLLHLIIKIEFFGIEYWGSVINTNKCLTQLTTF